MKKLIQRLEKIAKKNGDTFEYRINVDIDKDGDISYWFQCREIADNHTFACGDGFTIEEAIVNTTRHIPDACEHWGYKE